MRKIIDDTFVQAAQEVAALVARKPDAVIGVTAVDVPEDGYFVKGEYDIPPDAGTIRVKITDLLAESLEVEVK